MIETSILHAASWHDDARTTALTIGLLGLKINERRGLDTRVARGPPYHDPDLPPNH